MRAIVCCLATIIASTCCCDLEAQRDALVTEAYLPAIRVVRNDDQSINMRLEYCHTGGPNDVIQRQMYLIAYLSKDEQKLQAIIRDKRCLDKTKTEDLFLKKLVEDQIAVVLDSKTTKLQQSATGNSFFPFEFKFGSSKFSKSVQNNLARFDSNDFVDSGGRRYFRDRFKLLVFVPVNDCVLADKVEEKYRDYDFAKYDSSSDTDEYFYLRNAAAFLKTLPYSFQIKSDGTVLIE